MAGISTAIPVYVDPSPLSSAEVFFQRHTQDHSGSASESELLRSVRAALRGSGTEPGPKVHTACSPVVDDPGGEDPQELTWDTQTVLLSSGGVLRKKWDFTAERQPIQWACLGRLEQTVSTLPAAAHSSAYYTSEPTGDPASSSAAALAQGKATFGPFSRPCQGRGDHANTVSCVAAVFVFLRSHGKIYLRDGLEYTFGLPFIVRRAWPLAPHGVMIQRVLDGAEAEEAELTGDAALPTLFTLTSPFTEATAVGLASSIVGGFAAPAALGEDDGDAVKHMRSIPATEMVVSVSRRDGACSDDVVVTVDPDRRQASVWRYAFVKPPGAPAPAERQSARTRSAARAPPPRRRPVRAPANSADAVPPLSPEVAPSSESTLTEVPELPPLSSLPGMPPALTTTVTMASLVTGGASSQQQQQWPLQNKGRRNSLTRNDFSVTLDRMVLAGRMDFDTNWPPIEHGRMKAAYWMEKLHSFEISPSDSRNWHEITVSLFDQRWDGTHDRSRLAISQPRTETLTLFTLTREDDKMLVSPDSTHFAGISATAIRATRNNVWDLLVLRPDHTLVLLTHGLRELPLDIRFRDSRPLQDDTGMDIDTGFERECVGVRDGVGSSVALHFNDGTKTRATIDFIPRDELTTHCMLILSLSLPSEITFALHRSFLEKWSARDLRTSEEFNCFSSSLYEVFELDSSGIANKTPSSLFDALSQSSSDSHFREDPALKALRLPAPHRSHMPSGASGTRHKLLAPTLYALHVLGEDLRLNLQRHEALLRLAPVICRIAMAVRPEWADYWKRLCPDALPTWPTPRLAGRERFDDRLPVWPPDMSAVLYGRISNPDWKVPWYDAHHLAIIFDVVQSFEYGQVAPLYSLRYLTALYVCLSDKKVPDCQKRAENAVHYLVKSNVTPGLIACLPPGIAAPIREAARTCQLSPPGDWPAAAYRVIGRDDLAAGASEVPDTSFNDGYRSIKDFISATHARKSILSLVSDANMAASGEVDAVTGVELDLEDFTQIRFGQDRRLEEVARMLCSSTIPSVRIVERPELNEHDQTKEQQHQVVRIAERTLALPYGRAMFTFGSVPTVTREAYVIPKIEYSTRMQPQNIVTAPEPGKIPQDCTNWGEFHNGVAAGLRISPSARGIESSWIAFNRPSELTPEHAGFLYALGLTGHLKEMLTWHTFAYLTPKHDLTSIGVLLGLSAANVGSGNEHVTKLLAVHTPALLPTPTVDLNVSLMTQAAGIAGVGLLYMGTKNRRMAEVCLNQISRRDLVQPDLSNEHREAYTYAAALAFGMIMLGKGSSIPVDMALVSRLRTLIHGTINLANPGRQQRSTFDINLTSPAAAIALGLMYLRTERRDIADILVIPDTVLALNRIQPSFLLMRTLAKSLIMWDAIAPTNEWLSSQMPPSIAQALENRSQGKADDAMELAYYNIIAGCCFAVGLKYAGTARQEAYALIVSYFDLFSRLVYSTSPAFDHKIKRAAIREGLNLICYSLSMVMAGTGEISSFRRFRYAYGMYHQAFRYGIHVATHMSIGLLFLGGGRFTLGTSDAAIACMVAAFFPRSHHVSSDNKSYLQALRHLWVLAVEPRCLIARDVDTHEVVYLPVKITVKDGNDVGTNQMVAPTLFPDLDRLLAIRVDTPRYWPFYLDLENIARHKENLLQNQTLYVKRRTAFLSYTEDPRGSRSLFVRSGSSAGDAAILDFPQVIDTETHPASDLTQFITSFSNDVLFLAFADHFARKDGETPEEQRFHTYCYASLLDSILQDKTKTLQSHLTLYRYRTVSNSRYFNLRSPDLRFATEFYSKLYDRRFSGRTENNARPSLIRESTVVGAMHALDRQLDICRRDPVFKTALRQYACGEEVTTTPENWHMVSNIFSWYLQRHSVPTSTVLLVLRDLAKDAQQHCLALPPPEGTADAHILDQGIREVLHGTGMKMITAMGTGWSLLSLNDIIEGWKGKWT